MQHQIGFWVVHELLFLFQISTKAGHINLELKILAIYSKFKSSCLFYCFISLLMLRLINIGMLAMVHLLLFGGHLFTIK